VHAFLAIRNRYRGFSAPFWVIGNDCAAFTVQSKDSPRVCEVPHGFFEIVCKHITQSGFPLRFIKNIPKPAYISVSLAAKLVDFATFPDLIFDFACFLIPVFQSVKSLDNAFIV
jgi:hypothetical protein